MEFPYIESMADDTQVLHAHTFSVPLDPCCTWELLQHPETGEYFVDDVDKNPGNKPKYVRNLAKSKKAHHHSDVRQCLDREVSVKRVCAWEAHYT